MSDLIEEGTDRRLYIYIVFYPSPSDETLTWRRGQMEDYNIGKDTYV